MLEAKENLRLER